MNNIYMFGNEAVIMRMLRSEDQNRGFDGNLPFCVVMLDKKQIPCGSSNFEISTCHNLSSDHFDDKSLKD